jgi:hypothetical protein
MILDGPKGTIEAFGPQCFVCKAKKREELPGQN